MSPGRPGRASRQWSWRLATLSDPEYRQEAINVGAVKEGTDPIPPVGVIDVAVHAKGKTLDDCARALATGLRVEIGREASVDVDLLVEGIRKLGRKITLAIDALDEAAAGQSEAIVSQLIVPLGRLPQVKVLVGSRRSLDGAVIPEAEDRHSRLLAAFAPDAIIDDLEDENETEDDIADYVQRRLTSSDKHRDEDPVTIQQAAERVGKKAKGVFLYARIVSRTLQEQDCLDGPLPEGALDAFEQDIKDRFKGEELRVNVLLSALAWGEGKGLTRRVWPVVANALVAGEPPYNDDDVAWALSHAGWHIVEAGEDGQTVYRLAHQALADHYRAKFSEKDTQGRIVAALAQGFSGSDWLDSDRYLWRHLATHASSADRLDNLIQDPGYLAVADPERLLISMSSVKSAKGRRLVDIYERVVDRLVDVKLIERMAYIHMIAQMEDPELARALEPPVPTQWRCRWARIQASPPHRIVGKRDRYVSSIAFGEIDGLPVIISGSHDETIRVCNAHTGAPIGKPLVGHLGNVASLTLGKINGAPVIVSGGDDSTIRAWDARTSAPIGKPFEGHTNTVTSLAFGKVDGAPVIISGSDDRTIRLWDARTGAAIGRPLAGHADRVSSVAFGETSDGPVIASGSWDATVRRWSARTGAPIGRPLEGHIDGVTSVAFGEIAGAQVIVSGSVDKTIREWNAKTGAPIGKPLLGHTDRVTSVAFGWIDRAAVIVSASDDKTIRLWNAQTGAQVGDPLEGHADRVNLVLFGELNCAPVVITASDDRTIRVWNARITAPIGKPLAAAHTERVNSVVFAEIDGAQDIVSGSNDKTVRLWNSRTGAPVGKPFKGHKERVTSLAFGEIDGTPVVISGSDDKTVRVWNARTGASIGRPLEAHTKRISSVAFGEIDSVPVIVSGSDDKTITLWDARTATQICKPREGHTQAVTSVAFGAIDGAPVIASATWDRTIRRWDGRTLAPIGEPLEGHSQAVSAVAFGIVDGSPVIVSGSYDKTVRLWDARTGAPICKLLEGYSEWVTSVAFSEICDAPVIVSGTSAGAIYISDPRMKRKQLCIRCAVGDEVTSVSRANPGDILVGLRRGIALFEVQCLSEP